LKSNFSKFNHIHLIDPIYDLDILNQIRSNCFVYIHGHSAGGTNPSLVEAMSLKIPIIAFDCNFNRSTTDNNCLYFHSTQELFDIIVNIKSYDLNKISEYMYYFANNNYRWELITSKYLDLFNK
jgi:glycosyltransferase involved in cell wall biosynthesis